MCVHHCQWGLKWSFYVRSLILTHLTYAHMHTYTQHSDTHSPHMHTLWLVLLCKRLVWVVSCCRLFLAQMKLIDIYLTTVHWCRECLFVFNLNFIFCMLTEIVDLILSFLVLTLAFIDCCVEKNIKMKNPLWISVLTVSEIFVYHSDGISMRCWLHWSLLWYQYTHTHTHNYTHMYYEG